MERADNLIVDSEYGKEEPLLYESGLSIGDIEPAQWRIYLDSGRQPDVLQRLIRIASVNKALVAHRLSPLVISSPAARTVIISQSKHLKLMKKQEKLRSKQEAVEEEEEEEKLPEQYTLAAELGLGKEEYEAVRGSHSAVMDLWLNQAAYQTMLSKTRKPHALRVGGRPAQCRAFLAHQLVLYAKQCLKRQFKHSVMATVTHVREAGLSFR